MACYDFRQIHCAGFAYDFEIFGVFGFTSFGRGQLGSSGMHVAIVGFLSCIFMIQNTPWVLTSSTGTFHVLAAASMSIWRAVAPFAEGHPTLVNGLATALN
ncbi:MAG: hypothetical protein R2822_09415 [Spirosomataceae bacterium]